MSRLGPNREAWVLRASIFLASPGLAIIAPLVGDIRASFGIGNFEAGLVVSTFGIARMVADLPAGLLADRFSKKAVSIAGFALLLTGSLLSALAPGLGVMLMGRALTGIGSGFVMTTAVAWAGALAPAGGEGRLISTIEATWMTSATLSPVIGGIVAAAWGWRATFVGCALGALVSASLLALLVGTGGGALAHAEQHRGAGPRLLMSRPVVAAYVAGFTVFFNRNGVRNTLLPLFAASVLGLNAAAIGLAIAVVAGVTVLTTLVGGQLADRWGRKRVLLLGLAILLAGNLSLLGVKSQATLLAAAVVVGLGGLNSSVPAALITDAVPRAQLGGAVGGYRFVQDGGFVVGPLAIGFVLDRAGYAAGLQFAAGAVLFGLFVVGTLLHRERRRPGWIGG